MANIVDEKRRTKKKRKKLSFSFDFFKGQCILMTSTVNESLLKIAPVAQLDRASGYGPEGCRFDSYRVHHFLSTLSFHSHINPMAIKSFCIRIAESSDFDMLAAYEKT